MMDQKILKVLVLFCLLISFVSFPTKKYNGTIKIAEAATNKRPLGNAEAIWTSSNIIGGWAFDPDTPSTSITVYFEIDGQAAGSIVTNVYRSDVNSYFGITGNHGFNWTIPSQFRATGWHTVHVLAYDTNTSEPYRREEIDHSPARYNYTNGSVSFSEMVFDWSTSHCEDIDVPDNPARAFVDSSGNIQLLSTDYKGYRNIGSTFNNLTHSCNSIMNSHYSSDPSTFNNYEWISAPYTLDGSNIYALIHNEYHASGDWQTDWYNSITMASSTNRGQSYSHATPPNQFVGTLPYQWDPNVNHVYGYLEPSNIVGREGYYYVFVRSINKNNIGGMCVFRNSDFRNPSGWRAWNGSTYSIQSVNPYPTEPPNPQQYTCTLLNIPAGMTITSITYSTAFSLWLGIGFYNTNSVNNGFYYMTTSDFITWSSPQLLMRSAWGTSREFTAEPSVVYPSLIDHASPYRNFESSGASPYLYFVRENYPGSYDRDLLRIQISLP
jgi:hypothetical protein